MARSIKRAGGENRITNMSIASVKGVVTDSIRAGRYSIVLDHIKSPSQSLAAAVKELGGWGSTPIIVLARSAHMEDIGFLLPLFPDRADKYALRNFGRGKALTFANEVARQIDLQAVNEEEFLRRVVEYSKGNPGAIIAMVKMATHPKYRSAEQIKLSPLYIDFRLSWGA